MRKFLILFIIFCARVALLAPLLIANCLSQSITWQRTYDSRNNSYDDAVAICPSQNNTYFVVGSSTNPGLKNIWIVKINEYGDTLLTKTINSITSQINIQPLAAVSTVNGGCVMTGDNYYPFLLKIDNQGNVLWHRTYNGEFIRCYDIIKILDGGYIACGVDVNANFDGYIMKIDSLGNLQWQRTYPALDIKSFRSITLALNGGYILTGANSDSLSDTLRILLLKIDEQGYVDWEKKFTVSGRPAAGLKIRIFNQGYIIFGNTVNSSSQFTNTFFMKVDTSGNSYFTCIYTSNNSESVGDLNFINQNRLVFSITKDSLGNGFVKAKALITDSNGTIIKQRIFESSGFTIFKSILPLINGDIFFAGLGNFGTLSDDLYVVRSDSNLYAPPIGIIKNNENIPLQYKLYPAYPNPFNSYTIISYQVSKASHINIRIFDINGRLVKELINGNKATGYYTVSWDASAFASSVYFVTLIVGSNNITRKIILLK